MTTPNFELMTGFGATGAITSSRSKCPQVSFPDTEEGRAQMEEVFRRKIAESEGQSIDA
jgi:hypothetical protein